jgi:hypothetical protein
MKSRLFTFLILSFVIIASCNNSKENDPSSAVTIVTNQDEKKTDILIGGKLFTSFCWPDNIYKPVLYPVMAASGTEVTRGFPVKPREGEQVDHLHQVGIWLNYGNVNGLDFWGNGSRGFKEPKGGEIKHLGINKIQITGGEGMFITSENWLNPSGKVLLEEKSEYHFIADGQVRIIDRITKLTAKDTAVLFKDTKEGMFGMRVARQLELPSKAGVILIDSTGNPSNEKDTLNKGVTGNYSSSEGLTGEAVWGTRAKWMDLSGKIGDEDISIIICDHPKNPGYPTYWHARGYGLFSANPFGWKDFTKGKEEFNFIIPAKKSATFRYRVIITSGKNLTDEEINAYAEDFGKKYKRK